MIRRRILFTGLLVALFALGWWVGRGSATGDLYSKVDLFVEILHKIEESYVDPVEPSQLIDGAIKGMLRRLDPHSQYLDASAYGTLQDITHGQFSGIGIVVSVRDDYPTVISPVEGSPAWDAGIHSGDVIVKIDGKSSHGFSVEEAATQLRGPQGTSVTLTVKREGEAEDLEVKLIRREIVTKSVPYSFVADGGVGYLRLSNFSEKSGAEVREALSRLHSSGAKSLVLDMRLNPGGLLDQAVDVAEQFLPQGALVVYTKGRSRGQNNRFYASESRGETRWPMVVLVDEGSASASEIVAGSLQDRDRALVVGATTFGKGSVQSVFPLRGGTTALKLTTALYYTPSGRSIHRSERDSTLDEEALDEEDSAPEETSTPDSIGAAADTASRPVFLTQGGRRVFGGGGITPDLPVDRDTLPRLTAVVEKRGLAFRFANRWISQHPREKPELRRDEPLAEPTWKEFVAFLTSEGVTFDQAELGAQREALDRAVRRELARKGGGDAGAAKVALGGDPAFRRAVEVLSRARSARDVFAIAAPKGAKEPTAPGRSGTQGRGRRSGASGTGSDGR